MPQSEKSDPLESELPLQPASAFLGFLANTLELLTRFFLHAGLWVFFLLCGAIGLLILYVIQTARQNTDMISPLLY